jgi:23S rRNA (uracil1939-C5)-methyltransferase
VSDPAVNQVLAKIREHARGAPGALARWSEIEIRVAPLGPPLSLWLLPRDQRSPTAPERTLLEAFAREWQVVEPGGTGDARGDQRWPLPGGVELYAPPGGFVQVNWAVNVELVSALIAGAKDRQIATFIELYAGAGNFTLPLLRSGLTGVAVERAGGSIRAARRAARAQGLSDDTFVAGDAVKELARRARASDKPDLVLLDPPRTGAREAVPALLELGARFIAFCACDPVTLARDVKALSAAYTLDSVAAFDMFPHTHHVETLLWLRRTAGETTER